MNQQDISAEEAAINKAIVLLEEFDDLDPNVGVLEPGEKIALADAWAKVALAIAEHNRIVTVFSLAEVASVFVKNPSPENWAEFASAVEQYTELG